MSNLDWQVAVEEIKTVAKALKAAGHRKVGITGFCMGGALSFAGAQHSADIDAGARRPPPRALPQPPLRRTASAPAEPPLTKAPY